ncbi:hypothetical protein [Mesorhizobium sp.]|uniref:hypothetical protein n=1 Tax=Mesorhizobium sp. TaxID=1871066 RepID=UPI000FE64CCB|nr:hypothetical protein [Mesorhizobium sp.]RWO22172.1 MAG: hypothetical protein EOS09_21280 [Mesorhizobium sp.]
MSNIDDYAYDDQGNIVLIRYGRLPKQSCRHSNSIPLVSSAELPLIRQRADDEAERKRQKARTAAEEKEKEKERQNQDRERAQDVKIGSPISPQKRALQLDQQPENKRNADGFHHD